MCAFFFSSRRRHTRYWRDWSSDVCSSDLSAARDTYLDALSAALFAGRLAAGPGAREVAQAVRAAPRPPAPRKDAALLDGDRKSVVQGKSVDLGGRRIIHTKKDRTYALDGS